MVCYVLRTFSGESELSSYADLCASEIPDYDDTREACNDLSAGHVMVV